VQAPGAARVALLPAAGELSRDLLLAALQTEPLDHRLGGGFRPRQAVNAGDEFEILPHRQVLVEAEALGHVADAGFDFRRLGADVEAEAGTAAAIGREQPAEHADGRGLAGAVGP